VAKEGGFEECGVDGLVWGFKIAKGVYIVRVVGDMTAGVCFFPFCDPSFNLLLLPSKRCDASFGDYVSVGAQCVLMQWGNHICSTKRYELTFL